MVCVESDEVAGGYQHVEAGGSARCTKILTGQEILYITLTF